MMFQKTTLGIFFICFFTFGFAQDTLQKKSNHFVGIQFNQLIKQIFNFGGSGSAINNPYLLTYSVNSSKTGWGANFGLGYTFNEINEGDFFTARKTTINDFFFRMGFEKKTTLGRKWMFSSGIDIVIDKQKNKTKTTQNNSPTSFETITTTSGWGLGPRVSLNYNVTERILIGTEATYYFKSLKNTIENKDPLTPANSKKNSENLKKLQFNVPAVIFLILKF